MKSLTSFCTVFALASGPIMFLTGCGPDTPSKPAQIRGDFANAALQVVRLIEKAHDHQLNLGKDELPQDAINQLQTYARNSDETFILNYINGLNVIVNANADNEYYGCDAEINRVLHSRLLPVSEPAFPSCK
jgi:hypothetical protein